ncbi:MULTISPECIES: CPBP family intramembrane glutamic endopeptidase [Rossellomorea]|uniref:CPBP family intramembrane glutamic endopeptidase n=1 Tax=Rossellomorea TaxID=2837508 RepID=UPI001CCF0486|nr:MULTISPECIES: CPBP family intramembrane glutamic endopeptidase [Rossellomorea]MCA0149882.1 CPBP family intramembrane metalloprotease [Rossellomorea vietnamensis]WGG46299.1 CPBP family intramembrane metalloprotease [Rossellomorea sp. DA94]
MNRSPHTLFLISSSALFFSGIILLSYRAYGWGLLPMLGLFILYLSTKNNRSIASLFLFFLVGFLTSQCATGWINGWDISKETNILLNRSFLIFILVALAVSQWIAKKKVRFYMRLPDWSKRISMSSHTIPLPLFLLIGLAGSSTIFIPLIWSEGISEVKSLFLYAIGFTILNATLEELIWRGVILSSLLRDTSVIYAVTVTSIGFGLLHLSIGIPLLLSLLFSFGGLFYSIVVLKTDSIYPSIAFHMVMNMGMVLNGWIN